MSSAFFQKILSEKIINKVKNQYDINLKVRSSSFNWKGQVLLNDLIVNDHMSNILFSIGEINLSFSELKDLISDEYNFNKVNVSSFRINLNHYKNDKENNFDVFFKKIQNKTNSYLEKNIKVEKVIINDGSIKWLNQNSKMYFSPISLEKAVFNSFSIKEKTIKLKVQDLIVKSENLLLKELSTDIIINKDSVSFNDLKFIYGESSFLGALNLKIKDANFKNIQSTMPVSLIITESLINPKDIGLEKYIKGSSDFKIKLELKGYLEKLFANIDFDFENSALNINSSIVLDDFFLSPKNYNVIMDLKRFRIKERILSKFFNDSINSIYSQYYNDIKDLDIKGEIKFAKNNFDGNLYFLSNKGKLNIEYVYKKNDNSSNYQINCNLQETQFEGLNFMHNIKAFDGNFKIKGFIDKSKTHNLSWESDIKKLVYSDISINNIKIDGKSEKGYVKSKLNFNSIDFKLKGELSFKKDYSDFNIFLNINKLNLSKLKLASQQKNVFFSGLINSDNHNIEESNKIFIKSPNLTVDNNIYSFEDIDISDINNNGIRTISTNKNDALDLELVGNFNLFDLKEMMITSLSKFYPFIKSKKEVEGQFVDFNIEFKNKFVSKLFPELNTPKNSFLKGKISPNRNNSFLQINMPTLKLEDNLFQSIVLTSSKDDNSFKTSLSAKNILFNDNKFSDLTLNSERVKDTLYFNFNASSINNSDSSFESEFRFFSKMNGSRVFELDSLNIINGNKNEWSLVENQTDPTRLIFNYNDNKYKIENFKIKHKDQEISFSGIYNDFDNLKFKLNVQNVFLREIFLNNKKFNFHGISNGYISYNRFMGIDDSKGSISVNDLFVNNGSYGDFKFDFVSSQEGKYSIESTVFKNQEALFKTNGEILIDSKGVYSDLVIDFNKFDLSFLSGIGKGKVEEIEGDVTGIVFYEGELFSPNISGKLELNNASLSIPYINTKYSFENKHIVSLSDEYFNFENVTFYDSLEKTYGTISGNIGHKDFKNWSLALEINSNRILAVNRPNLKKYLFYGKGFLNGKINILGPTKNLKIDVNGSTALGTSLTIPWQDSKGLLDTSFIDFISKGKESSIKKSDELPVNQKSLRGLEMTFNLDINNNAELEIVVDKVSGSTLKGRGVGDILMETNSNGKFDIWGEFILNEGIYNFKNLGLIDKKFKLSPGGSIIWEGNPIEAKMNLEAIYEVPGGANPAILVDNPNFNKKIPTNVSIKLQGNLLKPDDPDFQINFPNTSGTVVSEINYRLADKQRRQLQAISLLSQGIFISEVSISPQGIANNLYEKASEVISALMGDNQGKMNVGLNYLKGDKNASLDIKTEDRIGLTLTTQISDKILINGKIGVPVEGIEETLIVGDVQIDFILNDEGSLKAKVFNKENEFKYIGDELGYTQGIGVSYDVDFNSFRNLIKKIASTQKKSKSVIKK
ncbi:MAG: translocation/assembly module TamB [Flavobacteriaceae bacterium]|nr:translocation/assembly module TamB [Flavobacteriaceae bacterium]